MYRLFVETRDTKDFWFINRQFEWKIKGDKERCGIARKVIDSKGIKMSQPVNCSCGGRAEVTGEICGDDTHCWVICMNGCCRSGPIKYNRKEAIDAWNKDVAAINAYKRKYDIWKFVKTTYVCDVTPSVYQHPETGHYIVSCHCPKSSFPGFDTLERAKADFAYRYRNQRGRLP